MDSFFWQNLFDILVLFFEAMLLLLNQVASFVFSISYDLKTIKPLFKPRRNYVQIICLLCPPLKKKAPAKKNDDSLCTGKEAMDSSAVNTRELHSFFKFQEVVCD